MDVKTIDTAKLYELFHSELEKFEMAKINLEILNKEIAERKQKAAQEALTSKA